MIQLSAVGAIDNVTFDNMMRERQAERIRRLQSEDPYVRDAALREYRSAAAGREQRRAASDARRRESAVRRLRGEAAARQAERAASRGIGYLPVFRF